MRYIIYIDKVWLMDFVVSTYLLLLVKKAYGLKGSLLRIALCAAAGAAASVLLLLWSGAPLLVKVFLQAVCVEYLVLRAAFSFRTKEMVVRSYVCMGGYGLFLGGFFCAAAGFLPDAGGAFTVWRALAASTAAAGLVWLYLHFRGKRGEALCTVKLDFYGETIVCKGFADSGNGLFEPYGGRPVSVLEKQAAEKFLDRVPPEKCFLVPFHSIGREHGLLAAVELPRMEVEAGEQKRVWKRAVIALAGEKLAAKGNYQMILHPKHVRQEE